MARQFHPDKCLLPEEKQTSIKLSDKIRNKELLSELEKEQKIQIENKVKKFIEINEAYKVLSNQEGRKKYDRDSCYKHQNDNEGSENQQHEYPDFWHNFENYCEEWSKLIRIGTLFTCIDLGDLEDCSSLIEEDVDVNIRHNGSNHYIFKLLLKLNSNRACYSERS